MEISIEITEIIILDEISIIIATIATSTITAILIIQIEIIIIMVIIIETVGIIIVEIREMIPTFEQHTRKTGKTPGKFPWGEPAIK